MYPPHPAAEIFPMMPEVELAELAEDIRKNGLLEPIILLGGLILDGRNRLAACGRAGVEPRFTSVQDIESPTLYAVSKNLHRRHLTTSQRAAIGAEMMPLLQKEAKDRMRDGGHTAGRGRQQQGPVIWPDPINPPNANDLRGDARDIAGKAVGVGGKTIQRAVTVKKSDPEVFEQVKRGEVTVESAIRRIEEKAEPTKRQQQVENAAKRRMIDGLAHIRGTCRALGEINFPALRSACTAKEIKEWASVARDLARSLRAFAQSIEEPNEEVA